MKYIRYWLVTIRKSRVKEYVEWDQLKCLVEICARHLFRVRDYCLESHGKYKQLHCHMIVETNPGYQFKDKVNLFQELGYIMYFREFNDDIRKASEYIHKHCNNHCPEQLCQTAMCNYYKYHNGFEEDSGIVYHDY